MKKLSQLLLIGLGLGIFAVALSTIHSAPASASSGGAPVTVTNTPLPVQGTVGITGTPSVSAAQSGPWDVGISGNTSTNPLFVRDIDNPAKQPFASSCSVNFTRGAFPTCQFITVPVGKQLVIEMFTAFVTMQVGDRPLGIVLFSTANGTGFNLTYPQSFNGTFGGASDYWVVSQPLTRAYADPNTTPACGVSANLSEGQNASCTISGYLVNVP